MSSYFSKISGGVSICQDAEEERYGVRFAVARHGEDGVHVMEEFYAENPQTHDIAIVPIFAYGLAPRVELCTRSSLEAALPEARETIAENSTTYQQWVRVCEHFGLEFAPEKEFSKIPAGHQALKRKTVVKTAA